ncbi:hypothetical protein [Haloarchaeobius sp. TZWWS8]|uniref:hypothetical protein n=1 Tax=Haloarchaeobius sp. TZWWS8 TaxID=3446121 RepID=UPI003EBEB909
MTRPSTDRDWLLSELPRIAVAVFAVLFAAWFVEAVIVLLVQTLVFEALAHLLNSRLFSEVGELVGVFASLLGDVVKWTGLVAVVAYTVRRAN